MTVIIKRIDEKYICIENGAMIRIYKRKNIGKTNIKQDCYRVSNSKAGPGIIKD